MSEAAITQGEQYWLDRIEAGEAFDGNFADYARSVGLTPKELY